MVTLPLPILADSRRSRLQHQHRVTDNSVNFYIGR